MSRPILIVESETWLADHYEGSLRKNGYDVIRSPSGHEAIDVIDENTPSAIVMNLLLDGPNGIALLHELQSYVDTAQIPVIACTGLVDITLADLEPYGVRRLIRTATMRPDDIVRAVRSVTIG